MQRAKLPVAWVRKRWRSMIVVLLATTACGSRSALLEPTAEEGGTGADPCAPPSVAAACATFIAGAPAGSELWSTSLGTGSDDLLGPVAADASGTTFFVSAESALYVKTVFALDACGELRWQTPVTEWLGGSGYVPQVMVAGGHLVLVGVGTLVALDADTGELAWALDLDAFAESGGLGVTPGKVQSMGFTAGRSDGTLFSVVANDHDAWIVKATPTGKPSPVAKVASYLGGFGYPLGSQQLVLDSKGDVVLAGGSNPGSGDRIDAFTAAGKSVFATTLPSWGNGRYLASGPDYVTGEYLWLLGLDGALWNTFPGGGPNFVYWGSPTVIDEDGELFAVGGQHLDPGVSTVTFNLLGRFGVDGGQKWGTTLPEPVMGGPVLDDGDHVLVVTGSHLIAYRRADGNVDWQRELPAPGSVPSYWLLQNAAGALVTVVDGRVHAYASGGTRPPTCAYWPTPRGVLEQRAAPHGT